MTLRDARAAVLTRWHRDMGDNFAAVLPRVLDDMERIDAQHEAMPALEGLGPLNQHLAEGGMVEIVPSGPPAPTDADLAAWVERNPKAFADWAAKQARISGTAKPATRRRTTR